MVYEVFIIRINIISLLKSYTSVMKQMRIKGLLLLTQ